VLVYIPHTGDCPGPSLIAGSSGGVVYERGAMGAVNGIWKSGQRGFDLVDIMEW